MGAQDFVTEAWGRTPTEAYRLAVEDALYQYGHDPYNGTISTTGGYVEALLPDGFSVEQFIALVWANESGQMEAAPVEPDSPLPADSWQAREYEEAVQRWARFSALSAAEKRRVLGYRPQKWESCICVVDPDAEPRATLSGVEHLYTFFGLAAS